MKYIVIVIMLASVFAFSCKTQHQYRLESGTYRYHYKTTVDTEELILNDDSTFVFNSYKTSCSGTWRYTTLNTVIINCEDVDFVDKIQSGYMVLRQREIKIIGDNKLKLPISNNIKFSHVILNKED